MSSVGGAYHTRIDMATKSLDFAYCEVHALRRRLKAEPSVRDEIVTRSLLETASLMRSVSAQLRALKAQNRKTA
jgi:hypothetical protein